MLITHIYLIVLRAFFFTPCTVFLASLTVFLAAFPAPLTVLLAAFPAPVERIVILEPFCEE
jgi:hypothetical protein